MKNQIIVSAFLLVVLTAVPAIANVKVRTERTSAGQTYQEAVYIKEKRRRTESMNGTLVNITQCDAGRDISLNPALKTYSVSEFETSSRMAASPAPAGSAASPSRRGGTVTMTSTVKDTGERKQFFGYTARRITTAVVFESSADACTVNNSRFETDGWYIDETFGFDCGGKTGKYEPPVTAGGGCRDNYVTKTNGTAKKGFAVFEKTLIYNDGREPFEMTSEVKEISREPLDDSLFEVPEGYSLVSDRSQLYTASPVMTGGAVRGAIPAPASSMPLPNASPTGPEDSAVVTEKKPGVLRIGIPNIKVAASGENMPAQDLAIAFRNTLTEYLKTPDIEIVLLESRLPQAVQAEAERLECDAVIYGAVSHKKGGGGFGGMFGKVIAPAVGSTGIGQTGSVAGNIAGQAATYAIINAGNVAANTKAKDEITFDLDLAGTGTAGLKKQYKRKAKSAGEDLITSIVEQAAAEIVEALSK